MVREEKSEHAQKGEARSTTRKHIKSRYDTKIAGGDGLRQEPTNETRKTVLHNPDRRNEFFIEVQNKITTIYGGHRPPSHI
jgi:hypothetical protein